MNYTKSLFALVLGSTISCLTFSQSIELSSAILNSENAIIEKANYKGKTATHIYSKDLKATEVVLIKDVIFENGTLEIDLAGAVQRGADSTVRGFIGLAFRVQNTDSLRYECFYLRPTNGRAEDQLRRNHTVQYISHPRYPWYKLRTEFPGKYESYTDLEAGEWTHVKIVVNHKDARLFVNHAKQPCLIVNDLKLDHSIGGIGLWIGPGTDAYFSGLKLEKR
jgi:hypothetical protein